MLILSEVLESTKLDRRLQCCVQQHDSIRRRRRTTSIVCLICSTRLSFQYHELEVYNRPQVASFVRRSIVRRHCFFVSFTRPSSYSSVPRVSSSEPRTTECSPMVLCSAHRHTEPKLGTAFVILMISGKVLYPTIPDYGILRIIFFQFVQQTVSICPGSTRTFTTTLRYRYSIRRNADYFTDA